MKIRTRMLLTLFLFGLILLMTAVFLVSSFRQIDRLNRQEEIAQNIEDAARELSYLSNDYLLNQEEPQYERWQAQFKTLSADLDRLAVDDPGQKVLLDQLRTNKDRQAAVFSDVAQAIRGNSFIGDPGSPDPLEFARVSWSRMEIQNQAMVFTASQLTQQLLDQEERLRQNNVILIFVLAGIFGLYLVINYFFIYRRTTRSLTTLQDGIRTISSGDLDHAIDDRPRDEFGELSRAFNQMTTALREITAAKAELAREVSERQMQVRQAEFANQVELQRRLIQQRELERVDIARDLHDGVLQELTAISFALREAMGLSDKQARLEKLEWVQENLQKQLHDIRAFCNELRPPALAPFGLEKAIRSHIEEYQSRYPALEIHLNLQSDRQALPEETRMALFRVFQEVLNNVARHSKAGQLWVTWTLDGDDACLEIEDDGVGFEVPSDWVAQARSGHLGLVGMRERVVALGGEIVIDSRPGKGARVRVTAPRKAEET